MRKPPKRLLITGCGRSGTAYTSAVLRACGGWFNHESLYPDGMVSWFAAVDDPELTYLDHKGAFVTACHDDFDAVLHQVRHPLATLRSWQSRPVNAGQMQLIERHTSARRTQSPLEFAMRYWLEWNRMAEAAAAKHDGFTYPVEMLPALLPMLLELLELPPSGLPFVPPTHNANTAIDTYPAVTVERMRAVDPMLADAVCEQANRYGYRLSAAATPRRQPPPEAPRV